MRRPRWAKPLTIETVTGVPMCWGNGRVVGERLSRWLGWTNAPESRRDVAGRCVLITLGIAGAYVGTAAAATPRTVVYSRHPLVGMSASGGYLAWRSRVLVDRGFESCTSVHRLRVSTGVVVSIRRCLSAAAADAGGVVRADGASVYWTQPQLQFDGSQFDPYSRNQVAEYPWQPRSLVRTSWERYCGGDELPAMAVGGGIVAFSRLHWDEVDSQLTCQTQSLAEGDVQATGGSVSVVAGSGRIPATIAGVPASAMLATNGVQLAAVPFNLPGPVDHNPSLAASIELWNISSATLTSTLTPPGPIASIAMNRTVIVVVATDSQGVERIIRYDAVSGAKLGSTPIQCACVSSLSVGSSQIVYSVAKRIMALDTNTGTVRRLFTAAVAPSLVTIAAGHVFWLSGEHRINTIPT